LRHDKRIQPTILPVVETFLLNSLPFHTLMMRSTYSCCSPLALLGKFITM
jgi:hypothetical protein